ncbi:MAG: hypothetical protein HKO68_15120 [Desulfobacterales bacterium]|nr:glutaredoxin family protein [Deltaproteobacteria bacterium]NNL77664.1 hypothetical protein [Desulfobacterales bacterium]
MKTGQHSVLVEIVARKKGCMLCDLAIGVLEEISPEFDDGILRWEVVDVSDRNGLRRFDDLTGICGRRPAVPSIVIDSKIAFDNIPDMESLASAVRMASS